MYLILVYTCDVILDQLEESNFGTWAQILITIDLSVGEESKG